MKIQGRIKNTVIALGTLGVIAFFQNCSPVSFEQAGVEKSLNVDDPINPGDPVIPGGPEFMIVPKTHDVTVQANAAVDILFVVDNSNSMKEEQVGLANKINGFMGIIKDMDWQIALTTTDPRAGVIVPDANNVKREWGEGSFRPFDSDTGSKFVLKRGTDGITEAQNMLARAIDVGLRGSGNESGIFVTNRALKKVGASASHREFFRADSKLVVVLISDEDECSNGKCFATQSESAPESLIGQVKSQFGSQKVFKFNSIIRAPGDTTCSTAAVANTYATISHDTGGVVGSVCASDYTSILTNMGQKVLELVKSANLSCEPADTNNDGKGDVTITMADGSAVSTGFNLQGTTIAFDNSLPEGTHRISYSCLVLKK